MINKLNVNLILERDYNEIISRYGDIILALLIVLLISMMVIPVPAWLMDVLLTLNITIGISILIISLYISESIRIATFPAILLITTLFRLSLNISSTRLILLDGYAGKVINTFGQFVVGGNYVVGAVVFLIITVIQFIVIAKGAERVAEVAARFTLDALPGKQMSIDADLRSGLIDIEEAHNRRRKLEKEAQFYGAMDGAMKFVKGDAIASIIIIIINIIGGLLIGFIMKKMDLLEALQTYTILTIGDGLVSQIPALIISVAAGIIITRVGSSDSETNLGKEISNQILTQHKAFIIISILLFGFATVPGFPSIPFILLAAGSALIAFNLKKKRKIETPEQKKEKKKEFAELINIVHPLIIEFSQSFFAEEDLNINIFLKETISEIRKKLFNELGIILPTAIIRENNYLPTETFKILIKEVPVLEMELKRNMLLVNESPDELITLGIKAEDGPLIYDDKIARYFHSAWVNKKDKEAIITAGFQFWEGKEIIKIILKSILKKNAYEFIGIQETQSILDNIEKYYPALINSTIPKLISVQKLTDILRRLVQDDISIKDMKSIIEAIAEYAPKENDPIMLTEHVRAALKKYIAWKYSAETSILPVYLIDPHLEMIIQDSIQQSSIGNFLALDPSISQAIIEAARKLLKRNTNKINFVNSKPPIFLTQMEIRYFLKKILTIEFPEIVILSYQELPPDLQLQPIGKLAIDEAKGV